MFLFEAANEFKERLKLDDLRENIPEYFEALEIAVKCIEAQYTVIDYLDAFNSENEEEHRGDSYSRPLVMEFLNSCRFDYTDEEPLLIDGQTERDELWDLYQGMSGTMQNAIKNIMKATQQRG